MFVFHIKIITILLVRICYIFTLTQRFLDLETEEEQYRTISIKCSAINKSYSHFRKHRYGLHLETVTSKLLTTL